MSSIKLGSDTLESRFEKESMYFVISNNVDKFFNFAFIIEMVIKLIALGLCMDQGSYLRESWSWLLFLILRVAL